MQYIPILTQQPTFCLQKENHLEEERVDCETMLSVEPTNPQKIVDVLQNVELPFEESLVENVSCSR